MSLNSHNLPHRRLRNFAFALAFPSLLAAQDGRIDLTPITQFFASILAAVQGWFPWFLFIAFLAALAGAGFHSRRRMEWLGGAGVTMIVALAYIIGKAWINKVTNSAF